jgi:hypothetical protein
MTQTIATQHLSPEAIHQLVDYLPDYIKAALLSKSAELECSLEAAMATPRLTPTKWQSLAF